MKELDPDFVKRKAFKDFHPDFIFYVLYNFCEEHICSCRVSYLCGCNVHTNSPAGLTYLELNYAQLCTQHKPGVFYVVHHEDEPNKEGCIKARVESSVFAKPLLVG